MKNLDKWLDTLMIVIYLVSLALFILFIVVIIGIIVG